MAYSSELPDPEPSDSGAGCSEASMTWGRLMSPRRGSPDWSDWSSLGLATWARVVEVMDWEHCRQGSRCGSTDIVAEAGEERDRV